MQRLLLILMTCLLVAGCAKKGTFVLLPDPDGKVGTIIITNPQGAQTLNQARQSVVIKGKAGSPSEVEPMDEAKIRSLFAKALDVQPLPPARFLLFFKPDATQPQPESESEIPRIMQAIKDRHSLDISVNGHTDLTGDAEYNDHLSFQRAEQVRNILEKQGVDPSIITTTSHGKNNPLVSTPDNVPEPLNRRVEVIVR